MTLYLHFLFAPNCLRHHYYCCGSYSVAFRLYAGAAGNDCGARQAAAGGRSGAGHCAGRQQGRGAAAGGAGY